MRTTVGMKHGLHHGKRKPPDLVALAAAFAAPTKSSSMLGLPDRVVRQLTMDEIMDLKKLFDLYDVAGVGYTTLTLHFIKLVIYFSHRRLWSIEPYCVGALSLQFPLYY